jgi:hypothetical protein
MSNATRKSVPGGPLLDAETLTVSSTTVLRDRNQVVGTAADDIAVVTDAAPGASDHGLVVRVAGSAEKVDDAAFTPATDRVLVVGAMADETATDSVDEGDAGALRMTLKRELYTKELRAATSAVTQVGDSASSGTLLALNANRLGASIYNDSTAILRLKLGATASTSSFTVALAGNGSGVGGYYEVPANYTGVIDGIWASDAGGNALVTELSA